MKAPQVLLDRIGEKQDAPVGYKRLVIVMGQLGDFDSMEYAQALVPRLAELEAARIRLQVFAIGDAAGADRFCAFTGCPREALQVDLKPKLHGALGLYAGLQLPGGPWPGFLLVHLELRAALLIGGRVVGHAALAAPVRVFFFAYRASALLILSVFFGPLSSLFPRA